MRGTSLRVRLFRPTDLPAVMAIERASFRRDAYPRGLFMEYHARGALFLVASAGDGIAGYALAQRRGTRAELVSIAVKPGCRRGGAGKLLLHTTLRRLHVAGASRISLMVKTTNQEAQRFYESFGFRRVRRVHAYYEDGHDG